MKLPPYTLLLLLCCWLASVDGLAQNNKRGYDDFRRNVGKAILFSPNFGGHLPGGDLADRFGPNLCAGLHLDYITEEKNFLFGLEGGFLFSDNVEVDVLSGFRNDNGLIIGENGEIGEVFLFQRGFYMGAHFGKLFSLSQLNPRSGIRATVGVVYFQHKIRIQENTNDFATQFTDDYKKGFDRLSSGVALTQFLGYQLLSSDKLLNLYAGFEFIQGFTQNQRALNFDTRMEGNANRLDLLMGFKIGFTLPLYFGVSKQDVFY